MSHPELPAQGFWSHYRADVPHDPPDDMSPLEKQVFAALQVAFLTERAHSGAYVSFLEPPLVSLDGEFRVDVMAAHIAASIGTSIE